MAGNDVSSEGRSRTILWCVPRSGSTALTKCLSFIDGVEVWFEPYAVCLNANVMVQERMNLDLPCVYEGNEEVFRETANIFDEVCRCKSKPEHFSYASIKCLLESSTSTHVFHKDIAFAISKKYDFIPDGYTHTFLIRHPLRVFASLREAVFTQLSALGVLSGEAADEKTFDIGRHFKQIDPSGLIFKDIYDLWKRACVKAATPPVVIDGDDLMSNPAEILPKYCRAVGLPYSESLLKWDASTNIIHDWKLPAKEMINNLDLLYERAVTSTEFLPPNPMPDRSHVTPDVIRCADQMMEYYYKMYEARIKI